MNTKTLLPLTAAALFAVCAGSMLVSSQSYAANVQAIAPATTHVVNMPTVTVRPSPEDAIYFHSNKIVDLATVTVRPEATDLAYFLADNTSRVIDMPVVTVRPSADDMKVVAVGVVTLAQQLASR